MKTRIIAALILGSLLALLPLLQGVQVADGTGPHPPLPPSSFVIAA